jgi:YfiH family protein
MPFVQSGEIRYYTFNSLIVDGVVHAVFTRRGGVSPDPWAALNVGGLVGDAPERVVENRQLAYRAVGREPSSMYDVWQVHGSEVVCADAPRQLDNPHLKADSILTNQPGVTLFMRFADCVPMLFVDPCQGVVGMTHAGWLGTVRRAAESAIQAMHSRYGSRVADIRAAIGPSICANHYEVGPDVVEQVQRSFGNDANLVLSREDRSETRKRKLDLWAANRLILEQAGIRQIETCGICTACNPEDWYSHRGEKGKTGRFGVLIGLNV